MLRAAQTCNGGMCINIQDPNAINGITYLQFGDNITYQITLTNQGVTLNGTNTLTFSLDPSLTFTGGTAGWNPAGGNNYQRTIPNNGFPQTYTLTAQMNQSNTSTCLQGGMQSSASLLFNGNNTVSETKDVYSIPDNYVRLGSTSSSLLGSVLTGEIFLEGTLYVDNNFSIQQADILCAAGVGIDVGWTGLGIQLDISKSRIGSCGTVMWRGVKVATKNTLAITKSTLMDAYRAAEFGDKSTGIIADATFSDNRESVRAVMTMSGVSANITFGGNNLFDCPANALAQAYQGQPEANGNIPHAGIYLGLMTMNILSPAKCTFDNLNNGICAIQSSLYAENCYFSNIKTDATGAYNSVVVTQPYDSQRMGAALAGYMSEIRFMGVGNGLIPSQSDPYNFQDCEQGLYALLSVLDFRSAHMAGISKFGIRSDIFNRSMVNYLNHNRINSNATGISVENCDRSDWVEIMDNLINLTYNGLVTPTPVNAIQILESNLLPDKVTIGSNVINMDRPGNGVLLLNTYSTRVANANSVFINGAVSNSYSYPVPGNPSLTINGTNCYNLQGGRRQLLSCNAAAQRDLPYYINTYQITDPIIPNKQYTGFRVNGASDWSIRQNHAGFMQNGFKFEGLANAEYSGPNGLFVRGLYGNSMLNDYIGLMLESSAAIGRQGFASPANASSKNTWHLSPFAPALGYFGSGFGAYSNNPFAWQTSPFGVHDNIAASGFGAGVFDGYWPPNNVANWFQEIPMQIVYLDELPLCAEILISPTTGGGGELSQAGYVNDTLSAWDYFIAQDSLPDDHYPAELLWQSQVELFQRLLGDSSLLVGDSLMQAFYDQHRHASVGKIADMVQKLADIVAYTDGEKQELAALWESQLSATHALLQHDSLLSVAAGLEDSLTLLAERETLLYGLDSLRHLHQVLQDAYATSRVSPLNGLLADIDALPASATHEQNYKTAYRTLVELMLAGEALPTPEQLADLADVAGQCPLPGGKAVFLARSLHASHAGYRDYDDQANCFAQGIPYRQAGQQPVAQPPVRLYPNPARDELTIAFDYMEQQEYRVEIYDLRGQKLMDAALEGGSLSHRIRLTALPAGVYAYRVLGGVNTLKTGLITLQP